LTATSTASRRFSSGGSEGKYHRLTKDELDALVRQHDDAAAHLALNDTWRQEGRKHYLEWLFGSGLSRSAKPTTAETPMLRLLKRAGQQPLL